MCTAYHMWVEYTITSYGVPSRLNECISTPPPYWRLLRTSNLKWTALDETYRDKFPP